MDDIVYPNKPAIDEHGVQELTPHQKQRLEAGRCVCCGKIEGHRDECPYRVGDNQ
jgi:hypothetical protein